MTVVVGTTTCAVFMDQPDTWKSWLKHADQVAYMAGTVGHDVKYFAALELDARGIEPMRPLVDALEALGGEHWTFTLDDGRTELTTGNRLRHITTGQNLVTDYCVSTPECSHLLFMAADCAPPHDVVPRMLEMDHPLVAPYIDTYGLRGPVVLNQECTTGDLGLSHEEHLATCGYLKPKYPYHVENAMASAACVFIARSVFTRLRWRWDLDSQMSDDPCYQFDARENLGIDTYVRHDVKAKHYPEAIGAVETRGHDLAVHR